MKMFQLHANSACVLFHTANSYLSCTFFLFYMHLCIIPMNALFWMDIQKYYVCNSGVKALQALKPLGEAATVFVFSQKFAGFALSFWNRLRPMLSQWMWVGCCVIWWLQQITASQITSYPWSTSCELYHNSFFVF